MASTVRMSSLRTSGPSLRPGPRRRVRASCAWGSNSILVPISESLVIATAGLRFLIPSDIQPLPESGFAVRVRPRRARPRSPAGSWPESNISCTVSRDASMALRGHSGFRPKLSVQAPDGVQTRVDRMDQPDGIPGGRGGRTIDRARLRAGVRRWALFGAGVAAALLAVALYGAVTHGPPPLTTKDVQANIDQALASMTPPPAFSQVVYDQVKPSIVLIEVTGRGATPGATAAPSSDPSSPPDASPAPGKGKGLGSGVIVSQRGDILTSLHVVRGASSIKVT